jgi:hypothetical protein
MKLDIFLGISRLASVIREKGGKCWEGFECGERKGQFIRALQAMEGY